MSIVTLRKVLVAVVSTLFILGINLHLGAQGSSTGTILGTVKDVSGGVIPDAMVIVTNTGTNARQVAVSDSQGRYRINLLDIGEYDVQGEKTGFQSVLRRGI